ncbi:MAG: S41 family peptidase, partial [Bacteroidota bacterium]
SIAAVSINNDKLFEIAKNIEIYTSIYKEINTHYVDEIDPSKLMRTGIDAMLESLDPYTNYYSESQIEGFKYMTTGKYNGIGARIRKVDDYPTVLEMFEESPALKAGMEVGDQIISIDGQSAKGKNSEQVGNIMRGVPDTKLNIKIKKYNSAKTEDIVLTRGEVSVPNVPYSGMLNEEIGYVILTTFTRNAGANVGKAIKELQENNPSMKGLVFDLRDNGGGLLREAVNISNLFIPKNEVVVTTKGKVRERDQSFKTLNTPLDLELPVVVLINKNTASASEIVSGVLQVLHLALRLLHLIHLFRFWF